MAAVGRLRAGARLIADRDAFVRAETRLRPVPHAPEISLHVADGRPNCGGAQGEELGQLGLPPPFWAFAWAGGQALARYLLDHPEAVRGRRVLDFASGSGLVAIAAAKAGAAEGRRLRHRPLRDRGHRHQRRGERGRRGCRRSGPRRPGRQLGRCSRATSATSAIWRTRDRMALRRAGGARPCSSAIRDEATCRMIGWRRSPPIGAGHPLLGNSDVGNRRVWRFRF